MRISFFLRFQRSLFSFCAAATLLLILSITACQTDSLPEPDELQVVEENEMLKKHFRQFQTLDFQPSDIYARAKAAGEAGQFEVEIPNSEGQTWTLVLNRSNLFAPDFKALEFGEAGQSERPVELIALEGYVKETGGEASFVVSPENFGGALQVEDEVWYLDPVSKYEGIGERSAGKCVLYRETDAVQQNIGTCAEEHAPGVELPTGEAPPEDRSMPLCWKLEVRAHGDWEYYAWKANFNYNAAVYGIALNFGQAEIKYGVVNLDFIVLEIGIFTSTSNPYYYPTSTNGNTLLNQTQYMWNFNSANRDVVVLFTGKNIWNSASGNSLLGLAYVAVVCNNLGYSYAVVETGLGGNWQTNLLAHEIGHTLGGQHTTTGIMKSSTPSGAASFSSTSINQMNTHIWFNHNCLAQGACW